MEENLKNGVVIMPKAIVDLVEKVEKTSADCKAIYDYLVAYKEAKKTFEMRKGDKVAFITKVEYLSDEVKTELFNVKVDDFEEAPSVESIVEELADKQDKLTAGAGIEIADDVISVDGDLVPVVSGSDKDKYLHTNASTGDLEWASVSGGGSSLNIVSIPQGSFDASTTISQLCTLIGLEIRPSSSSNFATLFCLNDNAYSFKKDQIYAIKYTNYGSLSVEIWECLVEKEWIYCFKYDSLDDVVAYGGDSQEQHYILPKIPTNTTVTHVLKLVSGTPTWVEEQA